MSGIYIPCMEMPQYCGDCPFEFSGDCLLSRDVIPTFEPVTRAADCPLTPVPDHGDLIDANALLHDMNRMVLPDDLAYTIGHGIAERFIEKAPTIIPADGKDGAE